jgi:ribose transport system substrate-binding protein
MIWRRLLFTLMGTMILACGVSAQEATPKACPLADGVLNLVWVPKALDNAVFGLGQVGAETRAAELNEQDGCRVEVLVAAPMNTVAEEQADLLNEIIDADEFDAIAVSCIAPDACLDPINRAVEAGIAVMTWDSDSPDSDRFTYYGTNNYEGGRAAADLLVRAMGESGQVALLSGVEESQNLGERIQGFTDYMDDYPNIDLIDTLYCNDDSVVAVDLVNDFMEARSEVDGWFFVGLWALAVGRGSMPEWEAATERGDLFTVAFDTLPFELELVREGYLHGLVGQKYWDWGYTSVQIVYDYVVNGEQFESFTDTGMDIVTINNVEAMIAAWESNDFTQPLPPPFEDTER